MAINHRHNASAAVKHVTNRRKAAQPKAPHATDAVVTIIGQKPKLAQTDNHHETLLQTDVAMVTTKAVGIGVDVDADVDADHRVKEDK